MNVSRSTGSFKDTKAETEGLNLYNESPAFELTLDDFELYALRRLKVLRKIEQMKMTRVPPVTYKERLDKVLAEELKDDHKDQKGMVDEASHFILRLSYCQNEELRRWFLTHESYLLEHRLSKLDSKKLAESVQKYARIHPIDNAEKQTFKDQLLKLTAAGEFQREDFYMVPFAQALDLVGKRQCFLHRGYAYIPQSKVMTILLAKYRTELSYQLAMMGQVGALRNTEDPEATRVYPLLKNLNSCLSHREPTFGDGAIAGQNISASNVSSYVNSMPLCMRNLHMGMQKDRKLRHWGRLQYGLFLKGAGLSMDDALVFFQKHFTAVTGEQFQKQYAYNIRHMYGKEGKRAMYTPYACSKIILGNAPATHGDHHGCPYKHFDSDSLGSMLQRLNIGDEKDRRDILALKKSQQYQLACTKHFEVMHPRASATDDIDLGNVGNHPNAWFRASVQYHESMSTTTNQVSPEK